MPYAAGRSGGCCWFSSKSSGVSDKRPRSPRARHASAPNVTPIIGTAAHVSRQHHSSPHGVGVVNVAAGFPRGTGVHRAHGPAGAPAITGSGCAGAIPRTA